MVLSSADGAKGIAGLALNTVRHFLLLARTLKIILQKKKFPILFINVLIYKITNNGKKLAT